MEKKNEKIFLCWITFFDIFKDPTELAKARGIKKPFKIFAKVELT